MSNQFSNYILLFVLIGHETTASAVSWSIHFIAKYPEMQAKIRAEVEEVFNGRTCLVA